MSLNLGQHVFYSDEYIVHRDSLFELTKSLIMMFNNTSTRLLLILIFLSEKINVSRKHNPYIIGDNYPKKV